MGWVWSRSITLFLAVSNEEIFFHGQAIFCKPLITMLIVGAKDFCNLAYQRRQKLVEIYLWLIKSQIYKNLDARQVGSQILHKTNFSAYFHFEND